MPIRGGNCMARSVETMPQQLNTCGVGQVQQIIEEMVHLPPSECEALSGEAIDMLDRLAAVVAGRSSKLYLHTQLLAARSSVASMRDATPGERQRLADHAQQSLVLARNLNWQ